MRDQQKTIKPGNQMMKILSTTIGRNSVQII